MNPNDLEAKLIENGIKNLKEFGYPDVNKENILTDYVYSKMFLGMLKENLGNGSQIDVVINSIIDKINKSAKKI